MALSPSGADAAAHRQHFPVDHHLVVQHSIGGVRLGEPYRRATKLFRPAQCSGGFCASKSRRGDIVLVMGEQGVDTVQIVAAHPTSSALRQTRTMRGIGIGSRAGAVRRAYPHGDMYDTGDGRRYVLTTPDQCVATDFDLARGVVYSVTVEDLPHTIEQPC